MLTSNASGEYPINNTLHNSYTTHWYMKSYKPAAWSADQKPLPSILTSLLAMTSAIFGTFSMYCEPNSDAYNTCGNVVINSWFALYLSLFWESREYRNEQGQFVEYIRENSIWVKMTTFLHTESVLGLLLVIPSYVGLAGFRFNHHKLGHGTWVAHTFLCADTLLILMVLAEGVYKFWKLWHCEREDSTLPSPLPPAKFDELQKERIARIHSLILEDMRQDEEILRRMRLVAGRQASAGYAGEP